MNNTIAEEIILSPELWSKILRKKSAAKNLRNLVLEVFKKQSEEIGNERKEEIEIRRSTTVSFTSPNSDRRIRSTRNADVHTVAADYTKAAEINLSTSTSEEFVTITKAPEVEVSATIAHDEIKRENGEDEKFSDSTDEMNSNIAMLSNITIEQRTAASKVLSWFKEK